MRIERLKQKEQYKRLHIMYGVMKDKNELLLFFRRAYPRSPKKEIT